MTTPHYSNALFADLYELTMAQAYWQHGHCGEATFGMFFRELPPDRGYLVFAGLEDVLGYLEELRFEPEDIEYLRSTRLFDGAFLDWLFELRFTGTVRAFAEGDLIFAGEPVVEVTGPIIEAQLAETFLMNQINLQTTLATKAARVMHAAQSRPVVEFAARRTHGTDAATKLARVSYMVGFAGTSNVQAAAIYGMPPAGTMAHSFITSYASERDAFADYADSFPYTTTLLVDTYDTVRGAARAVEVAKEMASRGHRLRAIRLDSGDLLELSLACRDLLDRAGLDYVTIFASGGLDEYDVEDLVRAGAPIGGFGVGTKLGVSADAPWTDCAYKLVDYEGTPVLKLSTGRAMLAGRKQVWRRSDGSGLFLEDAIATMTEDPQPPGARAMLQEVMRDGKRTTASPTLAELRERFVGEWARLPDAQKALRSPEPYLVQPTAILDDVQWGVTQRLMQTELGE